MSKPARGRRKRYLGQGALTMSAPGSGSHISQGSLSSPLGTDAPRCTATFSQKTIYARWVPGSDTRAEEFRGTVHGLASAAALNTYRKASGVGEGREAWGRRRLGGRHVVFAVEFRFLGSFWKKKCFYYDVERKKKNTFGNLLGSCYFGN